MNKHLIEQISFVLFMASLLLTVFLGLKTLYELERNMHVTVQEAYMLVVEKGN